MTVPEGVDYQAMDDEPSNLLFMIAAPNNGDVHLEVLSRLMTLLMDEDFRAKLLAAADAGEFLAAIDAAEKEKYPDEPKNEKPAEQIGYKVLAVTACPTGIAHTYMAAEALEKAGKQPGDLHQGGNQRLRRREEYPHPRGDRGMRRNHRCGG